MSALKSFGLLGLIASLIRLPSVEGGSWSVVAPRTKSLPKDAPPSSFDRRDNTILPVGVSSDLLGDGPALLHSNKFYSNFLIDGPARAAWTLPYIVTVNDEYPFGMYVSHPKYFPGESAEDGRLEWYANSVAKDVIMTALELHTNQETALVGYDEEGFSATVKFTSEDMEEGSMTTYLVRGMAYATALYDQYIPEVSSIHSILRVNGQGSMDGNHTAVDGRFKMELNDGSTWMLYSSEPNMELFYIPALPNEPNKLASTVSMSGTLRVALVPYTEEEDSDKYEESMEMLDTYAGAYPTEGALKGWIKKTNDNRGKYRITWSTAGDTSAGLLHYALPHHQDLLKSSVKTGLFLASPTKGDMELITATKWQMTQAGITDFAWVPDSSAITETLELSWIEYYLEQEINEQLDNVAGTSVYFGGKALMAYAQLCLVADELGRDDLVEHCVDQLEVGFSYYLEGTNGNPLVYDEIWGGIIGELGLEEGNEGADFYAAYYNDHHFHYSYMVNAAAVLAHLRPTWATTENMDWVEALIRDVNSPNLSDAYFPQFRSFDWFCGHSWARGLLFAYDGKDQESTSEDVNFFYAMTMWAIATGNSKLEGLGRLQTGVVTQSIQAYFLMKDGNQNHPPAFVENKVTGILFESKVDYTTWFGNNVEYIHGIQNIPVTAITQSVRDPEFVSQEWEQRLESVVQDTEGVWATVLYMSYATIQKHLAFREMLTSGVDDRLLRSWALYWAATRPDCDVYCIHDAAALEPLPLPTPAPTSAPSEGPWQRTPAVIPGIIEAEEFDYGGEGVAYSDTDPGNNGGAFRTDEAVDISEITTGYNVGWLRDDEYMRYTVDVETAADAFDFSFLVAAPSDRGGSFRIVAGASGCDDASSTDLSGLVTVGSTGSWTNFEPVTVSGSGALSVGETFIWLCVVTEGFNIDSFTMTAA